MPLFSKEYPRLSLKAKVIFLIFALTFFSLGILMFSAQNQLHEPKIELDGFAYFVREDSLEFSLVLRVDKSLNNVEISVIALLENKTINNTIVLRTSFTMITTNLKIGTNQINGELYIGDYQGVLPIFIHVDYRTSVKTFKVMVQV